MTDTIQSMFSLTAIVATLSATTGCFAPPATSNTSDVNATPSTTPTLTPAAGERAAKIIFRVTSDESGSFNSPSAGGTDPDGIVGHPAVRVFKPNGELLSGSGVGSTTWPAWLQGVEVGISGVSNDAALNPNCAKFTLGGLGGDTVGQCYNAGATWDCNGESGYYRVSEFDCVNGAISEGKGSSDDGVFIRAYFSRDAANLDPSENIMAVIEYSASGLNMNATASECFNNGLVAPEKCSDVTWKMFLRSAANTTLVSPFLTFIPPVIGFVDKANSLSGAGVTTRQVFLPLAADPTLQVFQLSRIKTRVSLNDLTNFCSVGGLGSIGNSPLCVGMVLYSITFYRI